VISALASDQYSVMGSRARLTSRHYVEVKFVGTAIVVKLNYLNLSTYNILYIESIDMSERNVIFCIFVYTGTESFLSWLVRLHHLYSIFRLGGGEAVVVRYDSS